MVSRTYNIFSKHSFLWACAAVAVAVSVSASCAVAAASAASCAATHSSYSLKYLSSNGMSASFDACSSAAM